MANEFVAKNGLISQNNTTVTGSLTTSGSGFISIGNATVSGSLLVTGSQTNIGNTIMTGSLRVTGSQTITGFTTLNGTGTSTLGSNLQTSAGLIVGTVGSTGVLGFGAYANNGGEIQSAQNNGVSIAGQLILQRQGGNILIGTGTDLGYKLDIVGNSPSGSLRISPAFTATSITASSVILITGSITQPASLALGSQIYGVNVAPTINYTSGSQTNTAFRVAPAFSGSSTFSGSQSNIVADFGAVGTGTQFSVNDITSGSIYMVNDVSGLPIIEALSDWTVNMYNYPTKVFQKTGSAIIITGSMNITGSLIMSPTSSFILPLTASSAPSIGSAYWSGSLLFIYNGTRYMSASFV